MKVTTHSLPGHTGEQELTTASVQDIKVKNGPVQRRNGHCIPALNRSYESQSGGGSVVVNDPHVLQKRRRRCTDTLCEVKSTPEESLLEEGDAVRCSASVGDDFRSIDGTCLLHATDGAHNQQLIETGKVGSGLNKSVCSCSCGTDHCEGCALSADSTASDVCASGCDSKLLTRCEWDNCSSCELDAEALLEHIRTVHVATQNKQVTATNSGVADDEPSYVCLWAGCKVYNKASCLLTWLERHIQGHVGAKPHRCIVAGCGARFASQLMLERHVNGHFAMSASPSISALRPSRKGDANSKLSKSENSSFCGLVQVFYA